MSFVLSTDSWPLGLDWLPADCYLVGGAVRDGLLGRYSIHLDLDFVLPQGAVAVARAIAHYYRAGFVLLDAERQIARVVFPQATLDFAQQEGETLAIDLQRRDYTVNAIAYHLQTGELIDPLQGQTDLQKKLIRLVSRQNLADDPLRLLRAYRQAAQLNFAIEPQTQQVLQALAPRLGQVAAERVQAELTNLLRSPLGGKWLGVAWEDGVLAHWLPLSTKEGMAQVSQLDKIARTWGDRWPALGEIFHQDVSFASPCASQEQGNGFSWLLLAKLACLLPYTSDQAEALVLKLKFSRAIVRAITVIRQNLSQLLEGLPSRRSQYLFFQKVGPVFPALVLLAGVQTHAIESINPLVSCFLDPDNPIAHPQPLVTGQDLMNALSLPPGPQVGQLLSAIQLAQAEGEITTPSEALRFAHQHKS